jgi:hypothetical protein
MPDAWARVAASWQRWRAIRLTPLYEGWRKSVIKRHEACESQHPCPPCRHNRLTPATGSVLLVVHRIGRLLGDIKLAIQPESIATPLLILCDHRYLCSLPEAALEEPPSSFRHTDVTRCASGPWKAVSPREAAASVPPLLRTAPTARARVRVPLAGDKCAYPASGPSNSQRSRRRCPRDQERISLQAYRQEQLLGWSNHVEF